MSRFLSAAEASPLQDFYIQQALARYFPLPEDAKSISMAGSSALTCSDSSCAFVNPAGLGFLSSIEFSGSYGFSNHSGDEYLTRNEIEQVEQYGYGIVAFPIGIIDSNRAGFGTIAFGYSRYNGETENAEKESTPDGHRRTLSYGIAPSEDSAIGYSITFYDDQLQGELFDLHSHARFLHLFGLQYRPIDTVTVAALYKLGIGQSDTADRILDSNGLSHLRQHTGALSISALLGKVSSSFGVDYSSYNSDGNLTETSPGVVIGSGENGNTLNLRGGIEIEPLSNIFVRSGMRWFVADYDYEREDLSDLGGRISGVGYSAGLGYRVPKELSSYGFTINYGFEYLDLSRENWQHIVTIILPINF